MRPWGQGEVLGHSHSIFDDWSSPGTVHGSLRYRILFRCRESFTLALLFRFIFSLHARVLQQLCERAPPGRRGSGSVSQWPEFLGHRLLLIDLDLPLMSVT